MAVARLLGVASLLVVALAAVTASATIGLSDASGRSSSISTGGSGVLGGGSSSRIGSAISHTLSQALSTREGGVLPHEPQTAKDVFALAAKILKKVEDAKQRAATAVAAAKQKANAAKGMAEWEAAEVLRSLTLKSRSQTAIRSLALLASSHVSVATRAVVLAGMAEQGAAADGRRLRGGRDGVGRLANLGGPRVSEAVAAVRPKLVEAHACAAQAAALAASIAEL